jgi:hypothetical protein
MGARICVVTSNALASCPRMVKAADALHGAGYRVRVVSISGIPWHVAADRELRRSRDWQWDPIDVHWETARRTRLLNGLRHRAARAWIGLVGPARASLGLSAVGVGWTHRLLARAASAQPADLVYGGTAGALAATARAAGRLGVGYALDLEDFHSEEQDDSPRSRLAHALMERVERAILPGAAALTAGSPLIGEAYAAKYGVAAPVTVNNTFPLPATEPELDPGPGASLRLYWFSQTLGPGRGLEDAVRAAGLADVPLELHVRGVPVPGYREALAGLAASVAPRLRLTHRGPEPADAVELCRAGRYDVGLAIEQTHVLNRRLCRTNKAFTYMLAGLAVAFTDTPGQRPLAEDLGDGALLYAPGDVATLAAGLRRWAADRALLRKARMASWEAARRRWHWEHPEERGALLAALARALGERGSRP